MNDIIVFHVREFGAYIRVDDQGSCFSSGFVSRYYIYSARTRVHGTGCLAWPRGHVTRIARFVRPMIGTFCTKIHWQVARCNGERTDRRPRLERGVKLRSATGIVIYCLRPDFPQIPSSALWHAHRSHVYARFVATLGLRVWSAWERVHVRCNRQGAGCFLTLLPDIAENFPAAIYRVYVPTKFSYMRFVIWSLVHTESCHYCLRDWNENDHVVYILLY